MVFFTDWYEALCFVGIFGGIVIVPCFFIVRIGLKLVNNLGHYPSKAGEIMMTVFWKYLVLAVFSLYSLYAFYSFFS